MTVYVFDVDGTLEISEGPIKLERLRELKSEGIIIYIVGNYRYLATFTTEFPNGNPKNLPKPEALKELAQKLSPEEKIYVADTPGDEQAALAAGYRFCYAREFK